MKLTVAIVLLIAASQAAEVKPSSRRQQNPDRTNTDKRDLEEGNVAIEKRAPVLPTATPSATPGIEYSESKESQQDKSPAQQIYATPVPQIAKISDVLTGQGPPYQTAIASHLYAPVSIYQARLGSPTTYEVSPPIASQLAYTEHKISYQPPQNAIQYNQKLQAPKQPNFARPINFQQPYQQQIFVQPQPALYSQQPQLVAQPVYQQIPQFPFQVQRPIQYVQNAVPQQQFVHRQIYPQEQQNLVQVVPSQPGIRFVRVEPNDVQNKEEPAQRELQSEEQRMEVKVLEKPAPQQNYNAQPQGAISYASFSQSQPTPAFAQQRQQNRLQYQPQPQPQYQSQPQPQYQSQPQPQYQSQPQYQVQQLYRVQLQPQPQQQYEIQQQIQYQNPQIQYQNRQIQLHNQQAEQLNQQTQYENPQNIPSKSSQESLATASTRTLPTNPGKQISYFRPGPVFSQQQPQQLQSQAYQQGPKVLIQNPQGAASLAAPSFPAVQYFGKFAQSIFGGYQQQ